MSASPRVSIVMRTYERPLLLRRALASVLSQTFTDWELILVNNGGLPSCVQDVVREVKAGRTVPAIRILHLPERVGMEQASNEGLHARSGSEFFAIHDDDDSWEPDFLLQTVQYLANNQDFAAVVTGVFRINEKLMPNHVEELEKKEFLITESRLTLRGLIGGNTFPPIAALFRTSLLDSIGYFDETLDVLGDWEFNVRLLRQSSFGFIPNRLANYHIRTDGATGTAANSITAGLAKHKATKIQLQDRWSRDGSEPNLGLYSLVASLERDVEELRNQINVIQRASSTSSSSWLAKIGRGLRDPRHGYKALKRRIFS